MQDILNKMMAETGEVKQEIDARFFGRNRPSRGFYIVESTGRWHLHHDGTVKDGVKHDSGKPAFWDSKESANDFFENWKAKF